MPDAVDEGTLQDWNQAVVCIYYQGRKRLNPQWFEATADLPFAAWPLKRAVDTLIRERNPHALGCIRLALAELCRTRANFENREASDAIARLATAFVRLVGGEDEAGTVSEFLRIEGEGDVAYMQALRLMRLVHRDRRSFEVLEDYRVAHDPNE